MKKIKIAPLGASWKTDFIWAFIMLALILVTLLFYEGGQSKFIYSDF